MDFSALDRHRGHIALSFSGGKDSLACIYLLRDRLDEVTVYHLDTGDLLPEILETVEAVKAFVPHFVTVRTDAEAWMRENGMPSDLVPHSAHFLGQAMGEGMRLVPRYNCCFQNLMWPIYSRIKADGNTLLIRGTKRVDMKRLPLSSGERMDDIELLLPLLDWSHEQVFDYLREQGAPVARFYSFFTNAPECARCPAWWGEKRAAYLKAHHPDLYRDYMARLIAITAELAGPINHLKAELEA